MATSVRSSTKSFTNECPHYMKSVAGEAIPLESRATMYHFATSALQTIIRIANRVSRRHYTMKNSISAKSILQILFPDLLILIEAA